jgi:glycerol kinase
MPMVCPGIVAFCCRDFGLALQKWTAFWMLDHEATNSRAVVSAQASKGVAKAQREFAQYIAQLAGTEHEAR